MGNSGPVFALIWYLLLILVILFIYAPKEKRPRLQLPSISTSTSVVALLILLLLITRSINDRPDGKLHITIVDVGMGDAALIQSPSGRYILIDGGPSSITLSDSLGRRLPLFTRVVDWLILTGTKEDQLGGLVEVIPRFPPASVLIAGPPRTGAYRYLVDHMTTESIPISQSKTGQSFDLTEGCKIEVINRNAQGATLLISFGNFRLLYAPSADPSSIEKWSNLASLQSVTAVLLPDGGSDLVSTSEWLAEIDPRLVLISVGAGNTRGLPSEPVLRALEGRRILRTDLNGTIDITTDGERMWVEVERTIHN
jgi:competence protein ComEC